MFNFGSRDLVLDDATKNTPAHQVSKQQDPAAVSWAKRVDTSNTRYRLFRPRILQMD
jgi:hypothetical protein